MESTDGTGRVLRVVGGFYRVADATGRIWECRLSGRLKLKNNGSAARGPVLPGDLVALEDVEGTVVIREVLPRVTQLARPAIANVDTCVVVQSAVTPPPNWELVDRILLQAQHNKLQAVICITKADTAANQTVLEELLLPYRQADFQCFVTSARTGAGIPELAMALADKVSTLAGPSGVGKSRLLNALSPDFDRKTGEISEKIARGKHTTRHVELLPLPQGGWVADTPGFSVLDLAGLPLRSLPLLYPEFAALSDICRFGSCLHRGEPGCAVAAAVTQGTISSSRYQRYLRFLKEIEENELRKY